MHYQCDLQYEMKIYLFYINYHKFFKLCDENISMLTFMKI